ncbi:MAG: pitrilysin family protein [Candidatus Bathyarchaeia archaeon]
MNRSLSWERKVLSNGLTVLLYPRLSGMTTQLSVAIKYGSNDDLPEKSGNAHFLEHMLVGGSPKRIKLHHEIEKLGGCSHFETYDEFTFSSMDTLSGKIAEASKALSGLLFDSTFEKDKLELERKVILNEIAEAHDNPQDLIRETLIKCLFKHHPLRNPVLGLKKTINQFTIDSIKKAHQNYYVPQNMILILTGNFSNKETETVLQDFQDRENNGSISRRNRKLEDSKPKKEVIIKRSGLTQAYLSFGLRTAPARDIDTPSLDLIESILGIGESSRLFVELREKRALTYDFEATNVSGLDYGYFSVSCPVGIKSLNLTQTLIHDELQKIKNYLVTKNELDKSKNLLLGDIFRSIDSSQALPRILTEMEIQFENKNALINYTNKILSLTEQNISDTANKYFQEENYSTAILTPKK